MNDMHLTPLLDAYAQAPSSDLMAQLVEGYLPLCHAIARRFTGRGMDLDDLSQVAAIALMKAIERYEPQRGLKFVTYATPTITGEIRNYLRDKGSLVRFSRDGRNQLYRLEKIRSRLSQELMREPTLRELAEAMEISGDDLLALLDLREASQIASMDAPLSPEDEQAMSRRLGQADSGYEEVEKSLWMEWVFSQVTPQEKLILQWRYQEQLGQREVAARLGVSQMQVSRLERRVLARLRQLEENQRLH